MESNYRSGTFILPPKPEQAQLLRELAAIAENAPAPLRGRYVTQIEAQDVLTLIDSLRDSFLRDTFLDRSLEDMISTAQRVKSYSTDLNSWAYHSRASLVR